ncbi:MAG: hypothetical protein AAB870_03220, partial [Patescibacteria group bacterium]
MSDIERKPFHESVVDAIKSAKAEELKIIAGIIITTKIPKNHEEIVNAWRQRLDDLGLSNDYGLLTGTVMEQAAEAKIENKTALTKQKEVDTIFDWACNAIKQGRKVGSFDVN